MYRRHARISLADILGTESASFIMGASIPFCWFSPFPDLVWRHQGIWEHSTIKDKQQKWLPAASSVECCFASRASLVYVTTSLQGLLRSMWWRSTLAVRCLHSLVSSFIKTPIDNFRPPPPPCSISLLSQTIVFQTGCRVIADLIEGKSDPVGGREDFGYEIQTWEGLILILEGEVAWVRVKGKKKL